MGKRAWTGRLAPGRFILNGLPRRAVSDPALQKRPQIRLEIPHCGHSRSNSASPRNNCGHPRHNCGHPRHNCGYPRDNSASPRHNCGHPRDHFGHPRPDSARPRRNCGQPRDHSRHSWGHCWDSRDHSAHPRHHSVHSRSLSEHSHDPSTDAWPAAANAGPVPTGHFQPRDPVRPVGTGPTCCRSVGFFRVQLSRSCRSSTVRLLIRELLAEMMASASCFFSFCISTIRSSTVSRQIRR